MPERTRDRQADPVRDGSTGVDPVESGTVAGGPMVAGPLDPAGSVPAGGTPAGSAGQAPPNGVADQVTERVREAAGGLTTLLHEAEAARRLRAEVAGGEGASAVCAWNHFENIPTFYNWNNRPR